jgi:cell division protein FtsL
VKLANALSYLAVATVAAAVAMAMATFGDLGLTQSSDASLFARRWVDPATLVAFAAVAVLLFVLIRQRRFRVAIAVALVVVLLVTALAVVSARYREQAIETAVAQFHQQRVDLNDESIRIGSGATKIDTRVREHVRNTKSQFKLNAAMPYYSRYDYSFVEPNSGQTLLASASFERGRLAVTIFDQTLPTP